METPRNWSWPDDNFLTRLILAQLYLADVEPGVLVFNLPPSTGTSELASMKGPE